METASIELRSRRDHFRGSGSGSTEATQNTTGREEIFFTPNQSVRAASERAPTNASPRGSNRSPNQALRAEIPITNLAEFGAQVASFAGGGGVCFTGASLLGLLSRVPKYASIVAMISGAIGVLLDRWVLMVITGLEEREFISGRVRGVAYHSIFTAAVSFVAVILAGCSWLITGPMANNEVGWFQRKP